jgi:hypothetical protein
MAPARPLVQARPFPTGVVADPEAPAFFAPALGLREWVGRVFLSQDSSVYNPDHAHLTQQARILWLWTNVESRRRGRSLIGEASLVQHGQSRWDKARGAVEARRWWDETSGEEPEDDAPDFVITLYAPWCAEAGDAEFMALVEHELYHCGQAISAFGFPKFSEATGRPVWRIVGHDVEEFTGVVRRYGVVSPDVAALVKAAQGRPEIGQARIAAACGTCVAA